MDKYFDLLTCTPLFSAIGRENMSSMLNCLSAKMTDYEKGASVFLEGAPATHVGIVLEGAVQVARDDYYGNRSVLALAEPGDLFGEVFACAGLDTMPVSVIAVKNSRVMLLDVKRILTVCSHACPFHTQLVNNLLRVVAQKNLALNQKIRAMSHRTTKEKVMAYLLEQAKRHNSARFTIPFDRQALADYLGVERSAMSAEIGKLKQAGILDCKGSAFHIKKSFP
jgi:CRP-like cAMP-binding protein